MKRTIQIATRGVIFTALALLLAAGFSPTSALADEGISAGPHQEWTAGIGIAPDGIPPYGFRRSAGEVNFAAGHTATSGSDPWASFIWIAPFSRTFHLDVNVSLENAAFIIGHSWEDENWEATFETLAEGHDDYELQIELELKKTKDFGLA